MPSAQGMSMFHRRLTLIAVIALAGAALPLGRVVQLTLIKGDDLRATAEERLVTRSLVETTRGKIIDRKGRVLATDVPGFDVRIDYGLISGQWVFVQAAREARRSIVNWNELSPPEREAQVQRLVPKYKAQLDRAWDALARWTLVPRDELEARRGEVVRKVASMAAELTELNRRAAEAEALERGRELGAEGVAAADVERPIREQRSAHTLVRALPDAAAFAFPTGQRAVEEGLLPGMAIVDGAVRSYPLEQVSVSIDRSGFPGPLRDDAPLEMVSAGVATAQVGWMRSGLYREELASRPLLRRQDGETTVDLGGYIDADAVGVTGAERGFERDLRGVRGQEVQRLDTGAVERIEREPGGDVTLTIDAALQARIGALMSPQAGLTTVQGFHNNKALAVGTMLPAAVVVLEVESGDVLAMVSTPVFTRQQLRERPASILSYQADAEWFEAERQRAEKAGREPPSPAAALPFLNRAVAKRYAPGSIVKPLVLNFAAMEGHYEPGQRIACTGHYFPGRPNLMRCWIYKQNKTTHSAQLGHDLAADEAVMVSCNIFFYTLGARLGPAGLAKWYGAMGVGEGPGVVNPQLGLGLQFAGEVLGPGARGATDEAEMGDERGGSGGGGRYSEADCAMLGIGQGLLGWTPLHAADAYATLARGGVRLSPRVRADAGAPTQTRVDLGFKPEVVNIALRGLERSVREERGTGHAITFVDGAGVPMREPTFNLPGVRVWGKSGTADSGKRVPVGGGAAGDEPVSIDHSWFVVLVGPDGAAGANAGRPRYAVAVMVENGGSGGRVAGPLCNQVLWQLRAEGYL